MTPTPQTQPVQTPEHQPGLLRRGVEAARSLPWVAGAEMTAHSAAEKVPNRNEVLAAGTAVVLAAGVGASEASAHNASTAAWTPTPAEAEKSCIDTALDSNPAVNFRYVRERKNGKMVPTRKLRVNLNDTNNNTGIVGGSCAEYEIKPREFETWAVRVTKNQKGKTSKANNSSKIMTKLVDGKMIGGTVFYDKFTVNLKKRPGKGVKTHIKVRETVFPKNGPPQNRVSTYKKERIPYPKNDEPI